LALAAGVIVAAVVGVFLALGLLANEYGRPNGSSEGPCSIGSEWVPFHDQATLLRFEYRTWPPGRICRAYAPDGELLGTKTFPQPDDWALAGVGFIAPFLALASYRWYRRRRRASSGTS
jgi:hypothetical protein